MRRKIPNLRWVRLKEPLWKRNQRDPGDPGWVLVWRPSKNWSNSLLHPFFLRSSVACDASSLPGQHLTVSTSSVSTSRKNLPTEDYHNLYLWGSHHQRWIRNLHAKLLWTKKSWGDEIVRKKNLAQLQGQSILKRDGMWVWEKKQLQKRMDHNKTKMVLLF